MIMNQEILKKIIENLKGKILNEENVQEEMKKIGFKKLPIVSINNGYKIDENSGWVTLSIINNSARVIINNDGIVL